MAHGADRSAQSEVSPAEAGRTAQGETAPSGPRKSRENRSVNDEKSQSQGPGENELARTGEITRKDQNRSHGFSRWNFFTVKRGRHRIYATNLSHRWTGCPIATLPERVVLRVAGRVRPRGE